MTAVKSNPAIEGPVVLRAGTAEDLMSANPMSLRGDATLHEAVAFLVDRSISGAPVIDEAGRPIGVLTQTDILIHDREEVEHVSPPEIEYGTPLPREWWDEFQVERVVTTPVRELMTPAVFCVTLDTPAAEASRRADARPERASPVRHRRKRRPRRRGDGHGRGSPPGTLTVARPR